jgi:hypothetical protein
LSPADETIEELGKLRRLERGGVGFSITAPLGLCLELIDAVEKVGGTQLASNYRIETSGSLNRPCVIGPCFESVLLACHPQNRFSTVSIRSRLAFALFQA